MITSLLLIVVSFAVMEPITALTHRCIMHGVGRSLHRSHHVNAAAAFRRDADVTMSSGSPRQPWRERLEANDAYPVVFAAIVMFGFAVGFNRAGWEWLVPIGIGITLYGAAYALVHDCYIHRRFAVFGARRFRLFDRLGEAHQQHHRGGGAPYGMLVPVSARQSRERVAAVPQTR